MPLAALLSLSKPQRTARFVVLRCFGSKDEVTPAPLPISNCAPLRLRVERQLGYKHAKYVREIELVASLSDIRGGKGGYWEDEGYEWYAGI